MYSFIQRHVSLHQLWYFDYWTRNKLIWLCVFLFLVRSKCIDWSRCNNWLRCSCKRINYIGQLCFTSNEERIWSEEKLKKAFVHLGSLLCTLFNNCMEFNHWSMESSGRHTKWLVESRSLIRWNFCLFIKIPIRINNFQKSNKIRYFTTVNSIHR